MELTLFKIFVITLTSYLQISNLYKDYKIWGLRTALESIWWCNCCMVFISLFIFTDWYIASSISSSIYFINKLKD
jgi:hypothetical protein